VLLAFGLPARTQLSLNGIGFAPRCSMMRIVARRMKAATVRNRSCARWLDNLRYPYPGFGGRRLSAPESCSIDTVDEPDHDKNGGILPYALCHLAA
jgi:hypothetical protein